MAPWQAYVGVSMGRQACVGALTAPKISIDQVGYLAIVG